jgi:hypothetical protein
MAGVLSAFLYSVAFALELWWIIEAKGKKPYYKCLDLFQTTTT